jgi:type IV secretory pathway TrbL component
MQELYWFGGSKWTSDIAINYLRTVLSIGIQLFTMTLIIGIGQSFIDQYFSLLKMMFLILIVLSFCFWRQLSC